MLFYFFFFFNDTATTEIYTLSLHDALPIWPRAALSLPRAQWGRARRCWHCRRSEEHTSELQSHHDLVCRLLLEKKNNKISRNLKEKQDKNEYLYSSYHTDLVKVPSSSSHTT